MDLFNRIYGGTKELEAWKTVPKILVYKKGEYYPYEGYFMRGMLLHFINRVINPVVYLKTVNEVEAFFETETEYEEKNEFFKNKFEGIGDYYAKMGKRVRVVGFFSDRNEYKNEIRLLTEAAQALAGKRDDLRVGLVTNKTVVKVFKEKYGHRMFDEYSHNSIVLARDNQFTYNDIEKESDNLQYWINKMSIKKTSDEINRETSVIVKALNQPVVYLYFNRQSLNPSKRADSKVAYDLFQHVAPFWFEHFNFITVEEGIAATENLERRYDQGITWAKFPSITIVTPKNNYFPIPDSINLGDRNSAQKYLEEHMLNFTKGLLAPPQLNA